MTKPILDFQIRQARPEDSAAIAQLLRLIGWFARMANESERTTQQKVMQQLGACLDGSSHSVYVATAENEQVVGYIAVHWLPYLMLPQPEGFVSELFIAETGRGQGIGRSLLDTIENEARQRGCYRLHLVNFRNRESYHRQFYEKAGWEERPNGASFVRLLGKAQEVEK